MIPRTDFYLIAIGMDFNKLSAIIAKSADKLKRKADQFKRACHHAADKRLEEPEKRMKLEAGNHGISKMDVIKAADESFALHKTTGETHAITTPMTAVQYEADREGSDAGKGPGAG